MVSIADEEAARAICTALEEAFNNIGRSLQIAKSVCPESESKAFSDHVGDLFYTITFKLLEPIYFQHPELRPAGWDDKPPMDPR
jgi:hypothetical protein